MIADDGNGVLSLDEFVEWFSAASEDLRKARRGEKLKQQQVAERSNAVAELEAAGELRKKEKAAERRGLAVEAAGQKTDLETLEAVSAQAVPTTA